MIGIKLTVDAAILQLLYYEQSGSCRTAAAIIHMHSKGPKPYGSALNLLVLRVLTDDSDLTLSLDNLALIAHRLYRRSYLHEVLLPSSKQALHPVFSGFSGHITPVFPKNVRLTLYPRCQ
jgi:hypothetical protein